MQGLPWHWEQGDVWPSRAGQLLSEAGVAGCGHQLPLKGPAVTFHAAHPARARSCPSHTEKNTWPCVDITSICAVKSAQKTENRDAPLCLNKKKKKKSSVKYWCLRVRQVARRWAGVTGLSAEADIFRGFASQLRGLMYTCHKSCLWKLTFKSLWLAVSWLEENELNLWKEQSMTEERLYIDTERAEGTGFCLGSL